jgi:glycosyltransferase involved in cell wall biosynthesis
VAIGIVGNFTPWKRHELFLEAAARVLTRHPQARFLIVGDEVFPENRGRRALLQEQARGLGLDRSAIFLGQRSDMEKIMQALDVLASAAEAEACSRAMLEAMASGVPVVAADAGGNPELVLPEDTGLLFPPGDVAAFAAAMGRLCEDRQARAAMGRNARRRAEREFAIERQVGEIQAIYDDLLR